MSSQPTMIDVYAPLPWKSKLDAQKTTTILSSSSPFTPSYVISSITQNSDPTAIYNTRVKGRNMLLENPARDSRAKKEMDRKREVRKREKEVRRVRRETGLMGRKKGEKRGVWKFGKGEIEYTKLIPLHHLWLGYMSELLGLQPPPASSTVKLAEMGKQAPSSSSMHPKLLKADFHGSILTVKQSKNPCLVGLSGILIHETENGFKIVTKESKVKLIPKQNSIFTFAVPLYSTLPLTFKSGMPYPVPSGLNVAPLRSESETPGAKDAEASTTSPSSGPGVPSSSTSSIFTLNSDQIVLDVPHLVFELYGNQFRFRSSERAGRKFKHKETIEL